MIFELDGLLRQPGRTTDDVMLCHPVGCMHLSSFHMTTSRHQSCIVMTSRRTSRYRDVMTCTSWAWCTSREKLHPLVMVFGPENPSTITHVFCTLGNHTRVVLCMYNQGFASTFIFVVSTRLYAMALQIP
jgi:hypothetical protein